MPVTVPDEKAALVLIDLQKGIAAFPLILVVAEGTSPGHTDAQVKHMTRSGDFADLIPGLDVADDDYRITKLTPGTFSGPELEAILKANGVTQLFVAGVATSNGVESTAEDTPNSGLVTVSL